MNVATRQPYRQLTFSSQTQIFGLSLCKQSFIKTENRVSPMMKTFVYRTKFETEEICQTVYAPDIDSSVKKWIEVINGQMDENQKFNAEILLKINDEFENNRVELYKTKELNYLTYLIDNLPIVTYIDYLPKGHPDIIAKIYFLTAAEGGRKTPAFSGYRPQFEIEGVNGCTSADQLFIGKEIVFPGETVVSEIRMFSPQLFKGLLKEGSKFKLAEGARKIADGIVIRIVNKNLIN